MNEEKKKVWRDFYKWTLFMWAILFLILAIWFLVTKRIPEFSQFIVKWSSGLDITVILPFKISRLWDFLVLPLWTATYALIYSRKEDFTLGKINLIDNNLVCSILVGGLCFNGWLFVRENRGDLSWLVAAAVLLLIAAFHSEIVGFMSDKKEPILSFSIRSFIPSILLNLSTGMTIGLVMIFSIGLVPGLIIGLTSFLLITFFQYTLIKFFRIIYYLFKLKILPWLGVKINNY